MGKAAIHLAGAAAVQPDDGSADPFQQAAVVADQHDGAAEGRQRRLQPLDGRQVEVVGGLVQQQQVGRGGQAAGERRAPRLAARDGGGVLGAGQAEILQHGGGEVGVVGRAEAGLDVGQRGGKTPRNQAPAAGSARWCRVAGRHFLPAPAAGRRRFSEAWICRTRCGRPGRRGRRCSPPARRRPAAGRRPGRNGCLGDGGWEAWPVFRVIGGDPETPHRLWAARTDKIGAGSVVRSTPPA